MSNAFQIARIVLVVALLAAAALVATPKGRLPLALRGVLRIMRCDGMLSGNVPQENMRVSAARRVVAMLLVLAAVALSLVS